MLKKNNKTKNPTLLVSAQFADSKPKIKKIKKINEKSTLKYTSSFSSFPFFWVMKTEASFLF